MVIMVPKEGASEKNHISYDYSQNKEHTRTETHSTGDSCSLLL